MKKLQKRTIQKAYSGIKITGFQNPSEDVQVPYKPGEGPKPSEQPQHYYTQPLPKVKKKSGTGGRAVYLHYPNFYGKASNAFVPFGLDVGKLIFGNRNVLPVGHGETLLISDDGKVKFVRYGRYKTGTGAVRSTTKGGNWAILDYPDLNPGETVDNYIHRLLALDESREKGEKYLEDSKYGAFEAIEIPNVNFQKAVDYAIQQSNDINRPEYSLANTCATGACNTIKAGYEGKKKPTNFRLIPTLNGSGANEGIFPYIWGTIRGTTNQYAEDMREIGSNTYIFNKDKKK